MITPCRKKGQDTNSVRGVWSIARRPFPSAERRPNGRLLVDMEAIQSNLPTQARSRFVEAPRVQARTQLPSIAAACPVLRKKSSTGRHMASGRGPGVLSTYCEVIGCEFATKLAPLGTETRWVVGATKTRCNLVICTRNVWSATAVVLSWQFE
jgi:hypothetical protein